MLPMAHSKFKPAVPAMLPAVRSFTSSHPYMKACHVDEVGVNQVTTSACGTMVSGWSFIFPLQNFTVPKYAMHVKNLPPAELFGHIVHHDMLEPISKLGSISTALRIGYTITLESK